MALGWQQLLIVLVLVLVLFGGRGRISSLMGDMAKGIKSFRSGLADSDDEAADRAGVTASLEDQQAAPATGAADPAAHPAETATKSK